MKKNILLLLFSSMLGQKVEATFFLPTDIDFANQKTSTNRNYIRLIGLGTGIITSLITYKLITNHTPKAPERFTLPLFAGAIPMVIISAIAEIISTTPISFANRVTTQVNRISAIIEPYQDITNWNAQDNIDRFVLGTSYSAETPFHEALTRLVESIQQINAVIEDINMLYSCCFYSTNENTVIQSIAPVPSSSLLSALFGLKQLATKTKDSAEALQIAAKLKEYANTARTALVDALTRLRQSPHLVREQEAFIAERDHGRELEKLRLKYQLRNEEIQTIVDSTINSYNNKLNNLTTYLVEQIVPKAIEKYCERQPKPQHEEEPEPGAPHRH